MHVDAFHTLSSRESQGRPFLQRGQSFDFEGSYVTIIEADYFRVLERLRGMEGTAVSNALEYLEASHDVTREMPVHPADAIHKAVVELLEARKGSRQLRRLKTALEAEYHMLD